MLIYLENNQQISGSDLLSAILRYDLVPIPVTLEITVKATDELKSQLTAGKKLTIGTGAVFEVIKGFEINNNTIKDGKRLGGIAVIAILDGCESLTRVTKRATVLSDTSFSEIYRSLGAKVRFDNDIKISNFVCLKGQIPTQRIAIALQKEAAVIVYDPDKNHLSVRRLQELINQPANSKYDKSQVQWIQNPTLESRLATNFVSIDDNGTDILGQVKDGYNIDYIPRVDSRELQNLRRVLITRGTIVRSLDTGLMAGKTIQIDDRHFVVLTTAYRTDTGALGGSSVMATKAWIADMVKN